MVSSSFKSKLGFSSLAILASLCVNPMVAAMDPMEVDQQQGTKRKLEDFSTQQSNKRIKTLPAEEFSSRVPGPTSLTLIDNEISDQRISQLTHLKELHLGSELENPNFTNASISLLTNLEKLSLCGKFSITDKGLKTLTNLTFLDLSFNNGIEGNCLSKFPRLRELNLFFNDTINNEDLSSLTSLENLSLGGNKNITFKAVSTFSNLKTLDIIETPFAGPIIPLEEQELLKKNNPNLKMSIKHVPFIKFK